MFRLACGTPSWLMFVALALLLLGLPAASQERPDAEAGGFVDPEPCPPAPHRTYSLGLGQTYGGVGGAIEFYLGDGRASLGFGAGRVVEGAGFGLTARGFFGPQRTRGWAEGSISLLAQELEGGIFGPVTERRNLIGPGVAGGLRLIPKAGLTFTLGAGAGRARGRTIPMVNLGVGWTTPK